MPYAPFLYTDFVQYILDKGWASVDDVGFTLALPGGVSITLPYGPSDPGTVYLFYYLSFGDIGYDDWAITCERAPDVFCHICDPAGKEIIDIGCPFWNYLTFGHPFKVTLENLRVPPKTFRARIWQLRMSADNVPLVHEALEDYIRGRGQMIAEIRELRTSIDTLIATLRGQR